MALALLVGAPTAGAAESPPVSRPAVLASFPHAQDAFTQGLVFLGEQLLESTGQRGASELRWVDLATGRVERAIALPPRWFGEGLAIDGQHRFIQLTWQAGQAIVWSRHGRKLGQWTYDGEGWGLTFDGEHLIRSDGSARLHWHSTTDFRPVHDLEVTDGDRPVRNLNELEWVNGYVLANVWQTRRVAVIEPATGRVVEWLDLSELDPHTTRRAENTLNGIAWLDDSQRLFVTGKRWGKLYEIEPPQRLLRGGATPAPQAAD